MISGKRSTPRLSPKRQLNKNPAVLTSSVDRGQLGLAAAQRIPALLAQDLRSCILFSTALEKRSGAV